MKLVKFLAAGAAVIAMAGTAQAQDGQAYVNVGVDTLEFDSYGIGAKVGYKFSDWLGAEVQGSIGVIDDEVETLGTTVDVGYDYLLGGFAVATLPVSDGVEFIGRVGYYTTEVTASAGNVSESATADGFAGGVGMQYLWDDLNGIRADYTYLDGDGGHADGFSVAYVRKF